MHSCRRRGSSTPLADPEKYESRSIVSEYWWATDMMATQALNGNHEGVVCRGSVVLTLNFGSCFAAASFA